MNAASVTETAMSHGLKAGFQSLSATAPPAGFPFFFFGLPLGTSLI